MECTHKQAMKTLFDNTLHKSFLVPVACLVLLTVCVVPPKGDFPLNDDWVYAKAVRWMLEEGRYTGHPFSRATLVAQVVWGALFVALFGFSFTTLHASTLVLAVITLWAVARAALSGALH